MLLGRRGVVVPYRTLHRFAVAELGFGRRKATVRVADGEPGGEVQVDFGRLGLVPDPASGRRRVAHGLIFTADALVWQLPLMTSCAEHGCRLEDRMAVELARLGLEQLPVTAVPEPVAALDRYTHQALTIGLVELPGRTVHAGVWFRLLRSLLNELTLPGSALNRSGKATMSAVWQAAEQPERAGLSTWRPYEHLPWNTQETLLRAAATVLQLAAGNRILLSGAHATALAPLPSWQVYEGDRPQPDLKTLAEQAIAEACVDPAAARQLLNMFTYACSTLDRFEQERAFLHSEGVPMRFLPSAAEFGRTDLTRTVTVGIIRADADWTRHRWLDARPRDRV